MASTSTQSNNARVKFRGHKECEMARTEKPMVGEALPHPSPLRKLPGKKYGKRMRKRARSAAKRGLISEKAMKSIGGY